LRHPFGFAALDRPTTVSLARRSRTPFGFIAEAWLGTTSSRERGRVPPPATTEPAPSPIIGHGTYSVLVHGASLSVGSLRRRQSADRPETLRLFEVARPKRFERLTF